MRKKNPDAVLTFAEAAALIGRTCGLKPSVSTIWRWAKKGVDGQLLEVIRIGRRYRTTAAAVDAFLNRKPWSGPSLHVEQRGLRTGTASGFSEPQAAAERSRRADEVEAEKERLRKVRHGETKGKGGRYEPLPCPSTPPARFSNASYQTSLSGGRRVSPQLAARVTQSDAHSFGNLYPNLKYPESPMNTNDDRTSAHDEGP